MLRVQNLLDGLGSDQVRSDFQKGRHGAVVSNDIFRSRISLNKKLFSDMHTWIERWLVGR